MVQQLVSVRRDGFTIVELLIVIVVIAILASISIVAYGGIQDRAKSSAAQTLASQIARKAEAWNAVRGTYADLATLKTGAADLPEARLDNPDVVVASGASPNFITATTAGVGSATTKTAGNGEVVAYRFCSASAGAMIYYWNSAGTTPGQFSIRVGAGC